MSNPSEYVFRKGQHGELDLVGDFEGLYRSQVDPWGQSANSNDAMSKYYTYSRTQLLSTIQRRTNSVNREQFMRGLEIGCGHGYVVDVLMHFTHLEWIGMDISPSAVLRAMLLFPKYKFYVGDITEPNFTSFETDVIVLGQILWYILHGMSAVMDNCYRMLVPGGLLIISQAFLTEPQRYGRDLANGFDGALKLLIGFDKFKLIEARYEDGLGLHHHDGIFILRRI
jgi:SAM-dependent methyltransferase